MVTIDKPCSDACAQRWSVVDELYWLHWCLRGCVRHEQDASMRDLEIVFRWVVYGAIGIVLVLLGLAHVFG